MRIGAKAAVHVLDVRLWCALGVPLPLRAPGAAPRQPAARSLGSGDAGQDWQARGPRPGIAPLAAGLALAASAIEAHSWIP